MTTPTAPADDALPAELAAALERMDVLLDPALDLLTAGPDSATAKGSRDDMRTIRDALADRASPSRAGPLAAWPRDAAEVRAFFDAHCEVVQYAVDVKTPAEGDRYQLTAHDFLSAINWWADYHAAPGTATVPAAMDVGAAQAETALRQVLSVVQRYLPPGGPSAQDAIAEIIAVVDPWPLGLLEKKS